MKQYLSPEQTAKLIELGFEKPKFEIETHLCNIKGQPLRAATIAGNYSIGELIEMLQKRVYQIEDSGIPCDLNIHYDGVTWLIVFISERDGRFKTAMFELIDALYLMLANLKEVEVI